MTWAVTLHFTECANGHNISGAFVTDGTNTAYTDAYGNLVLVVYDDSLVGYAVNVGKPGFVTRYTVVYHAQSGTTQEFCLNAAPPPEPGTTHNGNGCFIVSATTGSPESAEAMRLNMMRDRILRTSAIATSLFDAIYNDYYSFSPDIARELSLNPMIREQVLRVAVRPFIAWVDLIELLCLQGGQPHAARTAAYDLLSACDAPVPAKDVAELLGKILRGEPTSDAPEPFSYLGERFTAAVKLPYVRWAVFEPIRIAWEIKAAGSSTAEHVVGSAYKWLAEAPLEQLPAPKPTEELDNELLRLACGPFADRTMRRQIGSRLARSWPESIDQLRKHGFVDLVER